MSAAEVGRAGATRDLGDAGELVDAAAVVAWLRACAAVIAERRDELTELDAAIGDADHGVNMDRGMQAVVARLAATGGEGSVQDEPHGGGPDEAATPPPLGPLLKTAGMTLVSTVGGAAGPLYGTFFLEMGKAAGERTALTATEWAEAVAAGVAGVQMRGKAEPGHKTMVDALLPAAARGSAPDAATREAAQAAAEGARATIPLVARKGRASYLGERSAGHQDPGATSSWLLLEAAATTLAARRAASTPPDEPMPAADDPV